MVYVLHIYIYTHTHTRIYQFNLGVVSRHLFGRTEETPVITGRNLTVQAVNPP